MSRARDIADGKFANDLTVDTNTLVVDATNNRVGIGLTAPSRSLHMKGSAPAVRFEDTDQSGVYHEIIENSGQLDIRADQGNTSTTGNMLFKTGGTERMRLLAGGGLTFNGDTAAANALDDYEEGTFTANFDFSSSASGGMTWTQQTGRYIKVGSLVFISAFLSWSANGFTASSGALQLVGLPFTSSGTNAYRGGFYISYASNPFSGLSGAYAGFFRTETNSTAATFNYPANTDTLNFGEVTSRTKISSSGNFMITGSYTVV